MKKKALFLTVIKNIAVLPFSRQKKGNFKSDWLIGCDCSIMYYFYMLE